MKPLCEICGTRHEAYQGHVFASNAASNRSPASNNVRVDGAKEKTKTPIQVAGVPGRADDRGSVLDGSRGNEVGVVVAVKQRWDREAYNAYQRDLMRSRRAQKKAVSMS